MGVESKNRLPAECWQGLTLMLQKIVEDGRKAADDEAKLANCPYDITSLSGMAWVSGYNSKELDEIIEVKFNVKRRDARAFTDLVEDSLHDWLFKADGTKFELPPPEPIKEHDQRGKRKLK